jgi:hypothetical protein
MPESRRGVLNVTIEAETIMPSLCYKAFRLFLNRLGSFLRDGAVGRARWHRPTFVKGQASRLSLPCSSGQQIWNFISAIALGGELRKLESFPDE